MYCIKLFIYYLYHVCMYNRYLICFCAPNGEAKLILWIILLYVHTLYKYIIYIYTNELIVKCLSYKKYLLKNISSDNILLLFLYIFFTFMTHTLISPNNF